MVKVLQLIDTLAIGGAERMCVNITNLLFTSNVPVVVCATRTGGALSEQLHEDIGYYILNKKHTIDIFSFVRLLKIVKKEGVTHIHAHSTSVFWAIGIKLFFRKLKVIWHEHYGGLINRNPNQILRLTTAFIDHVIVVNENLQMWMNFKLKINPKKITYLKNFSNRIISPINKKDPPVLLCIANLLPVKNQLLLINACMLLRQRKIKFNLYLVGGNIDKLWYNRLCQAIRNYGLDDVIKFMGSVEDVGTLLAQASIGVLSSDSEGLPLALLEYGLAGLPVVCTRVGQCAEVLEEGQSGWVVPPKQPEALAEALYEALIFSELAAIKGQRLKLRVSNLYSDKVFLAGYLSILEIKA